MHLVTGLITDPGEAAVHSMTSQRAGVNKIEIDKQVIGGFFSVLGNDFCTITTLERIFYKHTINYIPGNLLCRELLLFLRTVRRADRRARSCL